MLTGSTARAMLLVGPGRLTSTRLPMLEIESGGWLAVEATGISGIEVHAWNGTNRRLDYPLIPGHEIVGRVAEAVDDSVPFPIGTRVVLETAIRCGACRRCINKVTSCISRRPINAYGQLSSKEPPALWGGLAEYVYLDPGAQMHALSDDIPAEVGTFAHALAAGFTWSVELPQLQRGENLLIIGPGPRGLSALIAAKAAGARWVGVAGLPHDRDRLMMATELGADMVVNVEAGDVGSAVADSLGARPDIVLDVTSDDPEAIFMALDLVRAGGRVVLASTKGTRAIQQLFSDIVVVKELTVRGALGASSAGYHWATRHLADDDRIDRIVSHEFPLSEAGRAIQAAGGILGREELLAVAVTF